MRIIKEGKKPNFQTFECKSCGCVFEAEKEECRYIVDFGCYPNPFFWGANCPTCGKQVRISEEECFSEKQAQKIIVKKGRKYKATLVKH